MVIRCDIAIQELDYTVRFIPGTKNEIADSMSRLCPNFAITPDAHMVAALIDFQTIPANHVEALSQCHNSIIGHGGAELGQDWSTIKTDIKSYMATCPVCQKLNVSRP